MNHGEIPWATVLVGLFSLLLVQVPIVIVTYAEKRGIETRWSRISSWILGHASGLIMAGAFFTVATWQLEHGKSVPVLAREWYPLLAGAGAGSSISILIGWLWALRKARKQGNHGRSTAGAAGQTGDHRRR